MKTDKLIDHVLSSKRPDYDSLVSDGVDRVGGAVQGEIVNVHWCFVLRHDLSCFEVEELDEAVVVSPGGQQPLAVRVERKLLDQALKCVSWEFMGSLTFAPVKHFDSCHSPEMIDVIHRSHATDCE